VWVVDFRRGGGEGDLWGCRCRLADIENTPPFCEGGSGSPPRPTQVRMPQVVASRRWSVIEPWRDPRTSRYLQSHSSSLCQRPRRKTVLKFLLPVQIAPGPLSASALPRCMGSPPTSSIIWTSRALSSKLCCRGGEGEREYPEVSPPLTPGALPSEGCGGL
jgi:hypothetical protein